MYTFLNLLAVSLWVINYCTCSLITNTFTLFVLSCWHVEFPAETEETMDLKQYESTAQLLDRAAEKEVSASTEQQDAEVKLNSKKRKASSALEVKGKVCVS